MSQQTEHWSEKEDRGSWDGYFLYMAGVAASRSTCLRRSVGAVLVLNNRVLATGYNGAPSGAVHCTENGTCWRIENGIPSGSETARCRAVHAEQNCIIQAAKFGTAVDGATLYVTTHPCVTCAKMLVNAGVRRVVYIGEYDDPDAADVFREAGISVERAV